MIEELEQEEWEELRKKYLDKNSKYLIERELIESFDDDGLESFVAPRVKRDKDLKKAIDYLVEYELEENGNISEMEADFIKQRVHLNWWWAYIDERGAVLDTINKHIYNRLLQPSWLKYKKNFDVNDVNIRDVIGQYIELPENLNKNIRCPLHEDNSPSFRIYEHTNSFFCFGECHSWWNAVNFIAQIEQIDNKEAFKKLISFKW